MKRLIAAIDLGTTSTRCILYDRAGKSIATAQKEHRQIFPEPGWVEHDPTEIWQRTCEVIAQALTEGRISGREIAAVGITNQRETTLAWDRATGRPFGQAIVWQDTRTQSICDELSRDGGADRFRARVGLPLATYFSGPKMRWMLERVPGLQQAVEKGDAVFGTIDTWLIWNLTGGAGAGRHVTDVTNASRTMLMNLSTLDWDETMLSVFGVPRSAVPEILPSSAAPGRFGVTRADGPFGAQVPICGVLGDQQAALVGQVCFDPGDSKNTYGTGCFMLLNTGQKMIQSKAGLLTTLAYKIGDQPACYALEGSIAVTGALVQWLRDNLGLIASSRAVETLAGSVADNGGMYFVPAFSGLFAPHWRGDARGTIVGMTAFTNKGHFARAALEAAAYQTRDVLEAMRRDANVELTALRTDGGMSVNNLLMQFQADILGIPVTCSAVMETTALGAAYAAGLATGFWSGLKDLRAQWKAGRHFQPRMSEHDREHLYSNWLRAVERSIGWAR
jgi:glycerol kinase